MAATHLQLKNFDYQELFDPKKLAKLDQDFVRFLKQKDKKLHQTLQAWRKRDEPQSSADIISCAQVLESYLIELFSIEQESHALKVATTRYNPLDEFKKEFVIKRAKTLLKQSPKIHFKQQQEWLFETLRKHDIDHTNLEFAVATLGHKLLKIKHQELIDELTLWCAGAMSDKHGLELINGWSCFDVPDKLEFDDLVPLQTSSNPANLIDTPLRERDGFDLTDERMSAKQVQNQVNYCIYCHDRGNDYCSKGFPEKKGDFSQLKTNPLGNLLTGCPLDEKISEMQLLKQQGFNIAALATIMIDNPMCPATGHRVCNDCMKSCIYQKQEPVDTPQIETNVLTGVLSLPWGVEIYDLLTRWNPLRPKQWVAKPYNGLKTLVAGMGPAGFTLAHHLLMEGFAVVGIDGLKIEPLSAELINNPIRSFDDIKESLDERLMTGFGGVAEYGITVRWDKNFLKLIYISLLRRPLFQVFGNVRFGGTFTIEDAWKMGFDHLSIAVGAGLPKALPIPGSMAPGMRQANDFLMALQLTGAAKPDTLSNLQIRLPLVVIGGGLTGVDTATEAQAYYIRQVEKIATRYETLITHQDKESIRQQFDVPSLEILDEYLDHANEIKKERQLAAKQHREPNFIKLIHQWGGVTIIYRRRIQDSPAYINNHHELFKALEEGVFYQQEHEPTKAILDHTGQITALTCKHQDNEEKIDCKTILVATGASPNIAYDFEHRHTFTRNGMQYKPYELINKELTASPGSQHCKSEHFGAFTSYDLEQKRVSFIGDTHPVFSGSVVKAIASGLKTYPKIVESLKPKRASEKSYQQFADKIKHLFRCTVTKNETFNKEFSEITIKAPQAAKRIRPGQLMRIQQFETTSQTVDGTKLVTDAFATTPCNIDKENGLLTFMIHAKDSKSKALRFVNAGDPIALMGPTGVRTKIPHAHETILILGDENSLGAIRSIGGALKQSGSTVIYIAAVANKDRLYCQKEIEQATDICIWATQDDDLAPCHRLQDHSISGTAIDALTYYAKLDFSDKPLQGNLKLEDVDRIDIYGNAQLLKDFQHARHNGLQAYLTKPPKVFGSVTGPMQCMLKGVCAQCLQWQVDPETGKRTKAVFACSWQDQPIELIDLDHIEDRNQQNAMQETLSNLWMDYISEK